MRAVLVLSACFDSPAALDTVRALPGTVLGRPDLDITRKAVTNLPYASMAARVRRGAQGLGADAEKLR